MPKMQPLLCAVHPDCGEELAGDPIWCNWDGTDEWTNATGIIMRAALNGGWMTNPLCQGRMIEPVFPDPDEGHARTYDDRGW